MAVELENFDFDPDYLRKNILTRLFRYKKCHNFKKKYPRTLDFVCRYTLF